LAWQPIAERELSSLADSSRCNIVAALFFSYIFWCVYIRDCCTPYTLPLGLLAILLTTPWEWGVLAITHMPLCV
jgi:hypothetical protein